MFPKEGRFPKHIAFLDQVEGLPNTPILWGVCYIMQIPSMEEITRMMGNVTSTLSGRASSTATEQGLEGKTTRLPGNKSEVTEPVKARDNAKLRNRSEKTKGTGKKLSD